MSESEFDHYASDYELVHNSSLKLVGGESREFLHAKLVWCSKFVARHFQDRSQRRTFLDYGCGTGRMGHEFYGYFDSSWDYVGIDVSQVCIQEARKIHARTARTPIGAAAPTFDTFDGWVQGDSDFDLILAAGVFHHIAPRDRSEILCRLWKRVRPGGALVIWEHNPWNPLTLKVVRDCAFDKDAALLSYMEMQKLWKRAVGVGQTGGSFVTFFPGRLRGLQPLERFLTWLPLGGQWVFWAKSRAVNSGETV